ncbi:MAG: DUF1232 domain-containing protein [Treponema sp.]|jgi:uncharacterized membrane protein YkvA (DUF1232 family)|nr:DUF1232 domain-containing protein [Treponema sp.]
MYQRCKAQIKKLKAAAKAVPYSLAALYLAYKRKEVPRYAKMVIILTIGYALSPLDLIPDFIPVLGYLDDLIIVPLLVYWSLTLIPEHVIHECREQAKDLWKNGKPKKWYYALPIVMIWTVIVYMIIKHIFLKDT